MAALAQPQPVALVVGLLSGDPALMRRAAQLLSRSYGPLEICSGFFPFDHTDYYADELGPEIQRWLVSFAELIHPRQLPEIKRQTIALEQRLAADAGRDPQRRPVNLDPGYLTLSKLVLATTKDYSHRMYLGQGIYGEVTLRFHDGKWQPWPWTYADYASGAYDDFFLAVRAWLKVRLAEGAAGSGAQPQ